MLCKNIHQILTHLTIALIYHNIFKFNDFKMNFLSLGGRNEFCNRKDVVYKLLAIASPQNELTIEVCYAPILVDLEKLEMLIDTKGITKEKWSIYLSFSIKKWCYHILFWFSLKEKG